MDIMSDAYAHLVADFPRAFKSETVARAVLIYRRMVANHPRPKLPDDPISPKTKVLADALDGLEQVLRDRDRT